ncbi:MAG: hypothetical protein M3357_14320, partial [Actinomycetota bacterium]|nr:hypothetical protein [Actinomycetota bacterium]
MGRAEPGPIRDWGQDSGVPAEYLFGSGSLHTRPAAFTGGPPVSQPFSLVHSDRRRRFRLLAVLLTALLMS